VSTDDLRRVLAEVEGKKPTQRAMAAINHLEKDEATLEDVAERYGYTAGWLSRWLDRLERLEEEPFEEVVYGKKGMEKNLNSQNNSTNSPLKLSIIHPKKAELMRPRGLFQWLVIISRRNLRLSIVSVMSVG
jgi:hypothetical protein